MSTQQLQERLADSAVVTGVGSTVVSWLTAAQPFVQFVATCLAIVSAGLAIAWHVWKFRTRNRKGAE